MTSIIRIVQDKGINLISDLLSVVEAMSKNVKGFHRLNPHPLFPSTTSSTPVSAAGGQQVN